MESGKYYVIGYGNNFLESMTKEQILAAITQAVESHEITDVDTGFVTKLKEQKSGAPLMFWVGSTAEYNSIETKASNCFYILTDDTELEDLTAEIARIDAEITEMQEKKGKTFLGSTIVPYGDNLSVQLVGSAAIDSYSIVKVRIQNVNGNEFDLLGSVEKTVDDEDTTKEIVCISGTGNPNSSVVSPRLINLWIVIDLANNVIEKNTSSLTVFYKSDDTSIEQNINYINQLKIVQITGII